MLSLLSGVLGLLFPPQPRHAMSYLSVLNVDLRRLVQLDCHGLDFYARWRLRSACLRLRAWPSAPTRTAR